MLARKADLPTPLEGFEHVNRYWDRRMETPAAKILPGECYVSSAGEMIVTVLGSCIAACVRDVHLGIGGMNHFMLPVQHDAGKMIPRDKAVNPELCYGNWAMEFLINAVLKLGGRRERLEVKVFGGGKVLSGMDNIDVGGRNVDFVLDYLSRDGLKVAAHDLGSDYPRKVLYFPDTGAVKMRRLKSTKNDTIEKRERDYIKSMRSEPKAGDIELF